MNPYLWKEFEKFRVGSALHLPFLYSAVIGLEAQHVFEVGAGVSTRVILDALAKTGGRLMSCSTESMEEITKRIELAPISLPDVDWRHLPGQSQETIPKYLTWMAQSTSGAPWFDLVFHDGSHSAEVVQSDLTWLLPRVKAHGLILIHDTLHSYSGAEMRRGLYRVKGPAYTECVTLPYGFGLTIIKAPDYGQPAVSVTRTKIGSKHTTQQIADVHLRDH